MERGYAILFYGTSTNTNETAIADGVKTLFKDGFGASRVDVPIVNFVE